MQTNAPQITVLMPAYNAAAYIREAIDSVLQQTFTDFELLIVNDGSTDETVDIIRSYEDNRIVLINQANGGVADALNTGLKHARAPYIARFDADDICYHKRLEIQYDFMLSNPEYIILGSAADYMDMQGGYVFNYQPAGHSDDQIQQLDYTVCPFIHSTVFYKKAVVVEAGGYNTHAYGFEDHFLWRQILKQGKVFNFSQSLITVRLNPSSVTMDEKWCSQRFLHIKYSALQKTCITEAQGEELFHISATEHKAEIKEGAYHALLAKKFLWNNHQPKKARENLREVLSVNRLHWKSYGLFALSFLPEGVLLKLYNTIK